MNSVNKADRRTFLRSGALGAGALWVGSLQELSARRAHGEYSQGRSKKKGGGGPNAYGPPSPKPDETTGLNLLQLPEGFRYWSYSWTGDVMSDGVACPSPNVSFKDVMSVFNAGGQYPDKLSRSETTIDAFIDRAAARLASLSVENAETIKKLVNPASLVQPLDELCR